MDDGATILDLDITGKRWPAADALIAVRGHLAPPTGHTEPGGREGTVPIPDRRRRIGKRLGERLTRCRRGERLPGGVRIGERARWQDNTEDQEGSERWLGG